MVRSPRFLNASHVPRSVRMYAFIDDAVLRAGPIPQIELRQVRSTLVAARDERRFCSFQFLECLPNILAATDLRRIALRADQDKIVVHHRIALDAMTLGEKFLFS